MDSLTRREAEENRSEAWLRYWELGGDLFSGGVRAGFQETPEFLEARDLLLKAESVISEMI